MVHLAASAAVGYRPVRDPAQLLRLGTAVCARRADSLTRRLVAVDHFSAECRHTIPGRGGRE